MKLNKLKKIIIYLVISFVSLSLFTVFIYRFVPIPYTPLMIIRSVFSMSSKDRIGIENKWVDLKQISTNVQRSVIRAEDGKFFNHNGFDYEAIEAAVKYNKTHAKKKGASTISQQTAKNVFLWPSRSWLRKGLEVYFTVLIEIFWSKERILEAYLNVIELGPGVYGVEAASLKYFHKNAKNLSKSEGALIAAVLPNPIKFKIAHPSGYVLRRQNKIMGKFTQLSLAKNSDLKVDDHKEFLDIKFDEDEESDAKISNQELDSFDNEDNP